MRWYTVSSSFLGVFPSCWRCRLPHRCSGSLPFSQCINSTLVMEHEPVLCTIDGRQALHGLLQQRCRRGIVTHFD